jgi:hypothetical protein
MSLPIISAPTYELVVPSSRKKIKYRPFLVKEQKALLLAQQSNNEKTMIMTLNDIAKACTMGALDGYELSVFDIEYIFTQIRARSVGEISTIVLSCMKCNDENAKINYKINLLDVNVDFEIDGNKELTKTDKTTIMLTEDKGVGLKLRYPSVSVYDNYLKFMDVGIDLEPKLMLELVIDSIDSVFDSENVYSIKDYKQDEIEEFLNSLTITQFSKITDFLVSLPRLKKTIEFDCPVCGYHHKHVLKGMHDFF